MTPLGPMDEMRFPTVAEQLELIGETAARAVRALGVGQNVCFSRGPDDHNGYPRFMMTKAVSDPYPGPWTLPLFAPGRDDPVAYIDENGLARWPEGAVIVNARVGSLPPEVYADVPTKLRLESGLIVAPWPLPAAEPQQ